MPAPKPPFLRFHELFEPQANGCWNWTGSTTKVGYGQFKVFGRMVAAHRYAFALYKGEIPDNLQILHSCDNKLCVNPAHLRTGTHAENMKEAADRGRMRSGSAHPMFGRKNPRPSQAYRVLVLGREFSSQNEAERCLGLGKGTVRYWVNNNPEKAQIISKGGQCL